MADDELSVLRTENELLRQRVRELEATRTHSEIDALQKLLPVIPSYIIRSDAEWNITHINRSNVYRVDEIIGRKLTDFILPGEHEELIEAFRSVQRTGQPVQRNFRGMSIRGISYYESHIAPLPDANGSVGICLIATDITEYVLHEARLRESEGKLHIAMEAASIGMWSFHLDEAVSSWDVRMREMVGTIVPKSIEEYVQLIVHEEEREAVAKAFQLACTQDRFSIAPHRIVRSDRTVRWVLAQGRLFEGYPAVGRRLIGATLDITESYLASERLRQKQKLESVGTLTAGIAHNFNNALMVIMPTLELCARNTEGILQKRASEATKAAQRAADTIRQLMLFAGQQSSSERIIQELEEVVEHCVNMCRRTFEKHIRLSVRYASQRSAISCQVSQIEQVVLNLLLNARDAVLESGRESSQISVVVDYVELHHWVAMNMTHNGAYVRLTINDDGVGMSQDVKARLFEPFFTTKEVGRGTGLGLATSSTIVREHQGFFEVQSYVGAGTSFSLYLPTTKEQKVSEPAHIAVHDLEGLRLLVIDDEASIRAVVVEMLKPYGVKVIGVETGEAALESLQTADLPQIILVDHSMPKMPGPQLISALRSYCPSARIILFTGQSTATEMRDRFDGVIHKPILADEFVSFLAKVLDQERKSQPKIRVVRGAS